MSDSTEQEVDDRPRCDLLVNLLQRIFRDKVGKSNSPAVLNVLDVGGYQGDFSVDVLEAFPDSKVTIMEPSPLSRSAIEQRFADNGNVKVLNCAASDTSGECEFNTYSAAATDSLLKACNGAQPGQTQTVAVRTLDQLADEGSIPGPVDLLKIDTQGNDLAVLRGGRSILSDDRPVVLLEAIHIPLYEGQCWPDELIAHMVAGDYRLAGNFMQHFTETGLLAFEDLLFVPAEIHQRLAGGADQAFECRDTDVLIAQNRAYKAALEG